MNTGIPAVINRTRIFKFNKVVSWGQAVTATGPGATYNPIVSA